MMISTFVPRPYQLQMLEHMSEHKRCGLWCFMGAGKTVVSLTAMEHLSLVEDVYPALVLAPLRVARSTWPDEVDKWVHLQHLRVSAIVGNEGQRIAALRTPADIYTMNYDNLVWLVKHWGDRWPYRTVIADESTRLKSFRLRQGGKRAQALARVAHTHCDRFYALTGTPAPNGLIDTWGQTWFLDKGQRLGRTYDSFRQRWFQKAHDGYGQKPLAHAQAEIQDRLRDICLTIDPKDWFDLDDPIVNTIFVDLPPVARQHYDEMEQVMFTEIAGSEVEAFGAAARTNKCLQLANGAAYLDGGTDRWEEVHDAKLDALESVIEEACGAPVMVAYHFKSDLARLKQRFPQGRHLDQSPATIKAWNAGQIPVLFAHPASAGHGLNLQHGGNILVYFAHTWNLEERQQILERIGPVRQLQAGYDRPVFVHLIVARDTVDELVIERVDEKQTVQEILLQAMKRKHQ